MLNFVIALPETETTVLPVKEKLAFGFHPALSVGPSLCLCLSVFRCGLSCSVFGSGSFSGSGSVCRSFSVSVGLFVCLSQILSLCGAVSMSLLL